MIQNRLHGRRNGCGNGCGNIQSRHTRRSSCRRLGRRSHRIRRCSPAWGTNPTFGGPFPKNIIARVLRTPPADCSFSQTNWKTKAKQLGNKIMQGRSKTRRAVAILLQRPCRCHTDRAASCARDACAYSEQNYVSTNTGYTYSYAKTNY